MNYLVRTVSLLTIAMFLPALASADDVNQRSVNRLDRDNARRADSASHAMNSTIRVSEMIGMNIQNEQGQDVGEIKDIVLDATNGKVRYAAVTYGGILGVGDKLFAVPYEAFECRSEPDDPSQRVLILNVTPQQLKGVTGFDQDSWPDFANKEFTRGLDKTYGVDRRQRPRERDIDVNVDRRGIDVEIENNRD